MKLCLTCSLDTRVDCIGGGLAASTQLFFLFKQAEWIQEQTEVCQVIEWSGRQTWGVTQFASFPPPLPDQSYMPIPMAGLVLDFCISRIH